MPRQGGFPIIWRAKPTLRGALATPRGADDPLRQPVLFPWLQIGWGINRQHVCDAAGEPLRRGGRPIALSFGSSGRTARVAARSQRRAYRQALERGQLRIVDSLRNGRSEAIVGALALLGMSLAVLVGLVVGAVRMARQDWALPLPDPYWKVAGTLLLLSLAGAGIYVGIGLSDLRSAWRYRPIRKVQLDAEGIEAEYRDGSRTIRPWCDIADVRWGRMAAVTLRFGDGQEMNLRNAGCRTQLALRMLNEVRRGRLSEQNERATRQEPWRLLLRFLAYGVSTSAILGLLLRWASALVPRPILPLTWLFLLAMPVALSLLGWLTWWLPDRRQLRRSSRRRA